MYIFKKLQDEFLNFAKGHDMMIYNEISIRIFVKMDCEDL